MPDPVVWECPFCYAENEDLEADTCWRCEEIRP